MADEQFTLRSRADARSLGKLRYFNGKPCPSGHLVERFVSNGTCCACAAMTVTKRRADNPEATRDAMRKWRAEHRDEILKRRHEKRHSGDPDAPARLLARAADRARRGKALSLGEETYASEMPCKFGHVGPRRTKCYRCERCRLDTLKPEPQALRDARAERRRLRAEGGEIRRATEARRLASTQAGLSTYDGAPCPLGHDGVRYVSNYGCVECARLPEAKCQKSEYDKSYRASLDPDVLNARSAAWRKKNPEKRSAIGKAYSAKRRSQEKTGDTTAVVCAWETAAKKVCYWCGRKCAEDYHVDHYQPLSKGGQHVVANLVIACPPCNLKKNAKDPLEFAKQVGRLF